MKVPESGTQISQEHIKKWTNNSEGQRIPSEHSLKMYVGPNKDQQCFVVSFFVAEPTKEIKLAVLEDKKHCFSRH
jgi:hypothetical protein